MDKLLRAAFAQICFFCIWCLKKNPVCVMNTVAWCEAISHCHEFVKKHVAFPLIGRTSTCTYICIHVHTHARILTRASETYLRSSPMIERYRTFPHLLADHIPLFQEKHVKMIIPILTNIDFHAWTLIDYYIIIKI